MLSQDDIVAENENFCAVRTNPHRTCSSVLYLEKYRHDAPCWILCFSHSQGGICEVHICQASRTTVTISGVWSVYDYDLGTISIKETTKPEIERQPDLVQKSVSAALKSLINSKPGDWTQVLSKGYRGFWSRTWTKEQFEEFHRGDRYPVGPADSGVLSKLSVVRMEMKSGRR
jgi:hypothetical protein